MWEDQPSVGGTIPEAAYPECINRAEHQQKMVSSFLSAFACECDVSVSNFCQCDLSIIKLQIVR